MSEPTRSSSFIERWHWLRPDRDPAPGTQDLRRWPDLGPAGRQRLGDLLQDALNSLQAELTDRPAPGASLQAGRTNLACRLLERERLQVQAPPTRLALAELVATRLEEEVPLQPARCLESLHLMPELLLPVQQGPAPAGSRADGHEAACRLRTLAGFLGHRLPRQLGGEAAGAAASLDELAGWLEALPDSPVEAPAGEWAELVEGGWDLAPLLARLEDELARVRREVDKRAEQVRQRYLGIKQAESPALPWVLEQLALDPAPAEQWIWLHQTLVRQAGRFLGQLGLEAPAPICILRPGWLPAWPDPTLSATGEILGWGDLASLDPSALANHLAWASHVLPPLVVAQEGLPGRAWALHHHRRPQRDLASQVIAALLRPADLETWSRWACDWMLRAGWQAGEARVRLFHARLEEWNLLLARADMELRLGIRPAREVQQRLEREGGVPAHVCAAAWRSLNMHPGHRALASARLLLLRDVGRRWRRNHREAGSADWFHLVAQAAILPSRWLREHLANQPAEGRTWHPLPPALVRPISPRGDGLLTEMEERLAALGRIRREDIEAGREFDSHPAAAAADPPADEESGGDDEPTA